MRLSEYASTQRTYGSRKVPRSVQQSIPIDRIYEDGTWRSGNVYSQMWTMTDINFTMSSEEDKAGILDLLGKVCINYSEKGKLISAKSAADLILYAHAFKGGSSGSYGIVACFVSEIIVYIL